MAVKKGKKEEKVVVKELEKRLDQAEMRKLEECHSDMNYAKSQMQVHDQYVLNVNLKIEMHKMEIRLLESELLRVKEVRLRESQKYENTHKALLNYGNELKLKYNIKSSDSIKYDVKSGKIVE